METVDAVPPDPHGVHRRHEAYLQTLWNGLDSEYVLDWIEIVGSGFIQQYDKHCYTCGTHRESEHPDLTIVGTGLRFVEVKGRDRMHANQASWITDIAKPLGLDVTILKVGQPEGRRPHAASSPKLGLRRHYWKLMNPEFQAGEQARFFVAAKLIGQ